MAYNSARSCKGAAANIRKIHRLRILDNSARLARNGRAKSAESQLESNAAELLEILYFVHDKGISAIGATMRGQLTRTQASILWLIRSEGGNSRSMLRKDVAKRLHNWFDLGSPAITTALQALAEPPLRLVRLIGNANSGREKKVILTAKGERFVTSMTERGQRLVRDLMTELEKSLTEEEIASGFEFLRASVSFFQRIYPARAAKSGITNAVASARSDLELRQAKR
jgi:DNA-binding MarR family transcriptional regulator